MFQTGQERAVVRHALPAPVRQTAVVAHHRKGGEGLAQSRTGQRPGGGVIHPGTTLEPPLKFYGILADVMGKTSQTALVRTVKGRGEGGTELCGAGEMVQDGLFPAVRRDVGEMVCSVHHRLPPNSVETMVVQPKSHIQGFSSGWPSFWEAHGFSAVTGTTNTPSGL